MDGLARINFFNINGGCAIGARPQGVTPPAASPIQNVGPVPPGAASSDPQAADGPAAVRATGIGPRVLGGREVIFLQKPPVGVALKTAITKVVGGTSVLTRSQGPRPASWGNPFGNGFAMSVPRTSGQPQPSAPAQEPWPNTAGLTFLRGFNIPPAGGVMMHSHIYGPPTVPILQPTASMAATGDAEPTPPPPVPPAPVAQPGSSVGPTPVLGVPYHPGSGLGGRFYARPIHFKH